MTRALFAPAGEVGAVTTDTIAARVDRGVALLDYGCDAGAVDYRVEPVMMDVREQRVGGR